MHDVAETAFLKTNQDWLFVNNAVFYRSGILDLEKGRLPLSIFARGMMPGQARFTYVLGEIPRQRGNASFAPSFAASMSEDLFRLTLADFNIHHDIAWVAPEARLTRQQFFMLQKESGTTLVNDPENLDSLKWQGNLCRIRALYELDNDQEWVATLPTFANNDGLPLEFETWLALYFARTGMKERAALCLNRIVEKKSTDTRQAAFLASAIRILLDKSDAVPAALTSFAKAIQPFDDTLSRFLQARLLCIAADVTGTQTQSGKRYAEQAWTLAQQVLQEGERPECELDLFWSRDFAPIADKLEPIIQQKRQGLRYCLTWSPARGLDQKIQHGETADIAMPLWSQWIQAGYIPHTLSAIEWQGKVRLLSSWRMARSTPEQDAMAVNRRANSLIAQVLLGNEESFWKSLENPSVSNIDVELANELVFRSATCQVNPQLFVKRVFSPCTPLLKYRLLLALGQYPLTDITQKQDELLTALADWLMKDADSGVHSACDWLLRTWKQDHRLKAAWSVFPSSSKGMEDHSWAAKSQGQEFVLFRNPSTFYMGISPDDGEASLPYRERPHWKQIGHSFALATREVTKREFLEYKPTHDAGDKRFTPTDDCPIGYVSWKDAAGYCNWLSKKERIPQDQWCYEIDPKTREIRPAKDYLLRTGYRLPLESEFEYACRGNSRLTRFFGNSPSLISQYVWHRENAGRQFHPVGALAPNPWGLFDIYGNANEWLNDKNVFYPAILGQEIIHDQPRQLSNSLLATSYSSAVIRSMSWSADYNFIRTSQRSNRAISASSEAMDLGFRVARTIR